VENSQKGHMKILLVEDDEATRGFIASILKTLDFIVDIEIAGNGTDAYTRYLECNHLDLVITDNYHPGMLGIELIERILARNPLQPIILQTGNDNEHLESFKQRHSEISFLAKPYHRHQLQDAVRAALKRNEPARE